MEDSAPEADARKRMFISGIILIIVSLILGKLVFIPLILFPGDEQWYASIAVIYIFSWLILILGVILAGIEGYKLVMMTYKDYRHKTVARVRAKSLAVREKMLARRKNL